MFYFMDKAMGCCIIDLLFSAKKEIGVFLIMQYYGHVSEEGDRLV